MKIGTQIKETFEQSKEPNKEWTSGVLNTCSLLCISLTWGHMLGLISIWFLPLTILSGLVGYGSEISLRNKPVTKITTLDL